MRPSRSHTAPFPCGFTGRFSTFPVTTRNVSQESNSACKGLQLTPPARAPQNDPRVPLRPREALCLQSDPIPKTENDKGLLFPLLPPCHTAWGCPHAESPTCSSSVPAASRPPAAPAGHRSEHGGHLKHKWAKKC